MLSSSSRTLLANSSCSLWVSLPSQRRSVRGFLRPCLEEVRTRGEANHEVAVRFQTYCSRISTPILVMKFEAM